MAQHTCGCTTLGPGPHDPAATHENPVACEHAKPAGRPGVIDVAELDRRFTQAARARVMTPSIIISVRYERQDGTVLTRETKVTKNQWDRAPMATFREKARKSASAAVSAVLGYKDVVKE